MHAPSGYCTPRSVTPGASVALHLSSPVERVTVEVVRDGAVPITVWRGIVDGVGDHALPNDAPEAGCRWPVAGTIAVGADWPSGLYLVRLQADGDASAPVTAWFVTRAATPSPDAVLLVLATTTWNAYNDVGGRNFYTGSVRASFERPLAAGMLAKPFGPGERVAVVDPDAGAHDYVGFTAGHGLSMWHGMAGWAAWERRFAVWAERAGYRIDVATSEDLHARPDLLAPYALFASVGHDEYWSAAMRDAVEGHVARGRHAIFLSGNVCYWQIRCEDAVTVCFKHRFREDPCLAGDVAQTTTIWSDPLLARPETRLTGSSFTRGGYARTAANLTHSSGGYTVHQPAHWLFEGSGLGYGDQLGAAPVVVGYECDGCELTLVDGRPAPTGRDGCPPDFVVLASAPAAPFDRHSTPLPLPPGGEYELEFHAARLLGSDDAAVCDRLRYGHAVLGTYTTPAGGTVVSTGCTDWVCGLDDPAVARVTRNLLDRLGRGRA